MFKNMKLSMKISLGFATLLLVAVVIGLCGWQGLRKTNALMLINNTANGALDHMDQCAVKRRDFSINGFEKTAGQELNAVEQFNEEHSALLTSLNSLIQYPELGQEERVRLEAIVENSKDYKTIFSKTIASQKQKDEAFAIWGKLGWDITNSINDARDNIIAPALNKAYESGDLAQIKQWASVRESMNEEFIQNFLVLRICGIYLVTTNRDVQWENLSQQLDKTKAGINAWAAIVKDNSELSVTAEAIISALQKYETAAVQYRDAILADRATGQEMGVCAKAIVENMGQFYDQLDQTVKAVVARTNLFLTTFIISGIVVGVVLSVVITRSIVKPVQRIINDLNEGAEQVASASTQVSAASQSLAEGATEQAAGLEETSSSLEEMSSMTKQNADNAQQANTLASESRKSAQVGTEAMQRMGQAITDIQKSSNETAKIIKVIDEIAFQTNLLALNAAVEAARAGEAGKGFAVVAEEVRNLAMRSAEAAKNTATMIEGSVKNAQNGVEISSEVGKVLAEIVTSISKTADLVGEISAASSEQAQGIDQVNTAVSQMDKVTQQNAANAEESASASEELNAQAEQMKSVVVDLIKLVKGSTAVQQSMQRSHGRVGRSHNVHVGAEHHVFHQIAAGDSKKKSTMSRSAAQEIPLDDDFSDFNA